MGISTTPSVIAKLTQKAHDHLRKSQEALKNKPSPDWTTFGKEMKSLELSLGKLVELTKQEQASITPTIVRTKHDTVKNPINNVR